jgi:hypothetical protein
MSILTRYGGPGQKSWGYSAFGQITGLCPCQLEGSTYLCRNPSAAVLAMQCPNFKFYVAS